MEKNGKVLSSAIEVIVKVLHQEMKIIGEGGGGCLQHLEITLQVPRCLALQSC